MSEPVCVIFRIVRKRHKQVGDKYVKQYEIEPMGTVEPTEKPEKVVLPKTKRSLL